MRDEDRLPAHDADRRQRRRRRRREPDRARHHGGDADARRLRQAHAARHLPRAAPRRARAHRRPATREDDVVIRSFVAHTHQWVLFFTSRGMAFREKVWQLPEGGAAGRGPLAAPGAAAAGGRERHRRAAAAAGREPVGGPAPGLRHRCRAMSGATGCRISATSAPSGLIAMKLDEGDSLIGVADLPRGRRRAAGDAAGPRASASRPSRRRCACSPGAIRTGVRGIRLARGRRGDRAVGAAPRRGDAGGARGLSARPPQRRRSGVPARRRPRPPAAAEDGEEAGRRDRADARTRRRAGGGRGDHPHRHRWRLRQAHLGLRIPRHRPRRAGHRRHHAVSRAPGARSSPPSRCGRATT